MRLITLSATILLSLGAVQSTSVKERLMYSLRTWVYATAHCAEAATVDGVMDHDKAKECNRCWAKVGDWATEEGQAAGNACLDEYEPEFREMCGALMDTFFESPSEETTKAVDDCWQECYMRTIAGKCVEATGGASKELEFVCIGKHLQDNMRFAKEKVYGTKHNFLKSSNAQDEIESVFEEGRCEHANEGNSDRKVECNACFAHVWEKAEKMWGDAAKNWDGKITENFDSGPAKQITSMWMFCADNYLAPAYSDCFENIDPLMEAIDAVNVEEWEKHITELEACATIKQAEHYFTDCKEGAGEGVEGLMSYVNCARNLTMTWVSHRRPDAYDYMEQYWLGGSPYPEEEM